MSMMSAMGAAVVMILFPICIIRLSFMGTGFNPVTQLYHGHPMAVFYRHTVVIL